MADIALWNAAKQGIEQAAEANKRLDHIAPLVHELTERLEKQEGEMKALKARLGKRTDAQL